MFRQNPQNLCGSAGVLQQTGTGEKVFAVNEPS